MANLYLFTGENTFLLRQERSRWIAEFSKKHGEENCVRIDGSRLKIRDLLDEVSVMPLLSEKRLVICDGVPSATKEEIIVLAEQIHPAVILLFIDPKIDKRLGGSKQLLVLAEVKEFAQLKGRLLQTWAVTYAQQLGSTFAAGAAELLLEFIGEDQDMLAQEIRKLSIVQSGKKISKEDIELMIIPTDEGVIWKISDMLSSGAKSEALRFAKRLLERGGDAYGLWSILLNMLKNLVAVSAAVQVGHRTGKDIADATGVHIFAVRSLQSHANRAKGNALGEFVTWAVESDKDLKTGVYRTSDEGPQELLALIDRFILRCP